MDLESPAAELPPPVDQETRPSVAERLVAGIEVLLCSDVPTQLLLGATLIALGFAQHGPDGALSIRFVALLSLADTVLLSGLIVIFLLVHGERPRDVFFGDRRLGPEALAGVPMIPVAFAIAVVVLLAAQTVAPWLHTVEHNPLQDLARTPGDAAMFGVVAVVAGGVREEVQRAFVLHRFERWLGGRTVGVVVASAAFGAGHLMQGADAAVATALLGAYWAVVYLRRRSVMAPMVSHSGFNLLQLAQLLVLGR